MERRWNGWGMLNGEYQHSPSPQAVTMAEERLGAAEALTVAELDEVLAKLPASRLESHPLLSFDSEIRVRHSRGQSLPDLFALRSGELGAVPDAVAFPETEEQIQDILTLAQSCNAIVIPYGGGTSVVGHINPPKSDKPVITLSLAKFKELYHLDRESQIATLGAGLAGPELEKLLNAEGYTLGHFPQSWELSTVGGWVASRSSGQQSLRYGRIEKMFAGGTMVTPKGTLDIPTFPGTSAGTDLREVVLGSEGRMGVISKVKMHVTPLAEVENFYGVFFPSWEQGKALSKTLAQQMLPLSMMRLSNAEETASHLKLGGDPKAIAYLEKYLGWRGVAEGKVMFTFGTTGDKKSCRFALKQVKRLSREFGGVYIGKLIGKAWEHSRFRSPYLRDGFMDLGYAIDTMETAVDWSKTDEAMEAIESSIRTAAESFGEKVHVFTHLSHFYPQGSSVYTTYMYRAGSDYDEAYQRWLALKQAGAKAIVSVAGTISHQHGVGEDHKEYLPAEKGELGIATIQSLCEHFDPEKIMNPGKLVD
ncbi:FAD-binding oxidoreductase [Pseudoteredinibacter isoporae]|uniref:Alkyldihydroxyacetonephosphate synthase n=1 Tax=Pseudoteredinibacter isoporae TaxID=570281 RepID=A0A7X0JUA4_9GAMM|nr:FAD-binding oxidoreductase [Pseudoteredinibacter isoporae]MBB6521516.1 alkyldihydroxyacetonephosphate synthase [Pseudoteredinibacter isoporae]NHO87070.1 FAD-binding oxidoreductase [Pseudoteredinibacter isoporae]NIB22817.1 FAD-binding oxidoreductase [Pseudoteredinibacter isoporae]